MVIEGSTPILLQLMQKYIKAGCKGCRYTPLSAYQYSKIIPAPSGRFSNRNYIFFDKRKMRVTRK